MAKVSSFRGVGVVALILFATLAGLIANYLLFSRPPTGGPVMPDGLRNATSIPSPAPLKAFSLENHRGDPFTEHSLAGNWTLLSFGYTHCPDICPTTLQMLARVDEILAQQEGTPIPHVVFVSIDPERDTHERLAAYVPYFNPRFIGVTGSQDALKQLTGQLGVIFQRASEGVKDSNYLMDHSASIILIDPQGRFKALFSVPHDAEVFAEDFRVIVAG